MVLPEGIFRFWVEEPSFSEIGMFCDKALFLYTFQSAWCELIFVVLSKSPVEITKRETSQILNISKMLHQHNCLLID